MKEFKLQATVTISIFTTVMAETLEEAIEIAQERPIEQSRWNDKRQSEQVWVSSEYDGDPENIAEY